MNYELLVLDIDGTVTNSKKEVMARTCEEVIRIQKQGIKVVLASGRPPEGIYPIARKLQLDQFDSYILAFNGGKIIHIKTGTCIFERRLHIFQNGCGRMRWNMVLAWLPMEQARFWQEPYQTNI